MENKGKTWSRGTNSRLPFVVISLVACFDALRLIPKLPSSPSFKQVSLYQAALGQYRRASSEMANERKTARREEGKSCKHIYRYLSSAQYPARFLKNRFTYQNVKGAVLEGFTCSTCLLDTARTTRSHWLSVEVNSQNWPINFFLDPLSPPSCKLPWILAIFFSRAAIERGRDVSNVSGTQDASKLTVT